MGKLVPYFKYELLYTDEHEEMMKGSSAIIAVGGNGRVLDSHDIFLISASFLTEIGRS